ncbi:Increased DNA methylation 1 [Hordeum vulgare]|uniref:DDT domain-containing protein PTM n=1 Tax=Hordeum vulgare subsp. vulgare TaxID=112509 RepID=A0A8I6WXN7_HORVV|nr:DDT domain-containing protein PTM [Hordeum vulgare subsp. vulgare]KAE8781282.1 Increased DNA methylation 1 [Hordeum vulgare]
MADLVGRGVRKAFPGFGSFSGVVESYDAEAGYFRVLYEDGDSEEVDGDEMGSILVGAPMPPQPETPGGSAGKRPKKRRRGDGESAAEAVDGDGLANGPVLVTPVKGGGGGGENGEVMAGTAGKKRKIGPSPVRRSARQAKAAALAAEMEAAANVAAAAEAAETSSPEDVSPVPIAARPQQSGRKRQRANGSRRSRAVARNLEDAALDRLRQKPDLPPSSQGLNLEGLPVMDVFQVYSCLRSFSKQLFLSPFSLETFVASLRCKHVNPLIDWVHFTLLRSLKNHLEDLAHEGDPPAIHCIRNLNWELLDLATWPIYLAEYLLTRGSELRYNMKLTDLKLLDTEYYWQPATVKLELLRSLCDDVIEIEAIRSELGSRMSELDGNDEGGRATGSRRKKRGSSVMALADSSQPPEGSDDMDDGNSDECYLCGMDGNLLCCDGCPLAFHSKCVGVVEDLLPEGEWYCPECSMRKFNGARNMAKLVRGAEVLGSDPHGRLYFGTCGYLLVVDSCDADSPCHYYGQMDLHSLITVLTPCHPSYNPILNVISLFRGIATETSNINGRYENSKECSTSDHETDRRQSSPKQPSEQEQYTIEKDGSQQLDTGKICTSNSDQDASHQNRTLGRVSVSQNSNETTANEKPNQTSQPNASSANKDSCSSKQDDVGLLHVTGLSVENQKDASPQKEASNCCLCSRNAMYINHYSFGQIAASAAGELKHKLSENEEGKKHGLGAVSFQLKTICKKYVNIFALTDQKLSVELLKEKCGWCNSCQISGGSDCIFRFTDGKCMESPKPCAVGPLSEKNKESHILLATHSMLSIEKRLNGLLCGPWQNPQHSMYWRKAVLMASDVSSLKQPLLTLESSLRRVAFSGEWQKPADSVEVVGSAAHILVRTSNKSAGYAIARKPGRKPLAIELKVDYRDVGVYWWRGGTLSRQVFHWKRLPQSLACKSARQAGRKKIPTIVYPDGSQFARRSKYIAWRAAVEMAQNVSQLILQIKELELNIKWTEILSSLSSAIATKETQKIARFFKKVIIRRKRIEATNVEYLLDFGKRENIPPVVAKHGVKFEEPSSERNRYWLSESHVPLSLLRAYEAKAINRSLKKKETDDRPLKKKDTDVLPKNMSDFSPQKPKRSRSVFDNLLEKAQKLEEAQNLLEKAQNLPSRLCGQCFKTVTAREAVNCKYCEALFHRKHFNVPRGAVDTVYVCNKCLAEKVEPVMSPQKKAASKKSSPKKKQKKQLRKSLRRRKQIVINLKKKAGQKNGKRGRPRKNPLSGSKNKSQKMSDSQPSNEAKTEPVKRISKRLYDKYMKGNSDKSEHTASCRKKKRTASHYSYWLDGLRWTQNTDDEQATCFRKARIVFPSEDVKIAETSPVCCLCKKSYSRDAIYIACENCEDWFHGDIYSITIENANNLIGFKCHACRLRAVPVCPYAQADAILKDQSDREDTMNRSIEDKGINCPKDLFTSDDLKELHGHNIEELQSHSIEEQVPDSICLEVLEDYNDLKEPGSHSTEKELDDCNGLKEPESHNNMEELDCHSTEKELDDCNGLKEPESHNNMEELDSHSIEKELDDCNGLKELESHNNMEELDSHITERSPHDHNNLNEHDSHWGEKKLDDCNCLSELGNLNDMNSPKELDCTENSKFAVGEIQCLKELDNLKDLGNLNSTKELDNHHHMDKLDRHSSLKELENHSSVEDLDDQNRPNELGNHQNLKELHSAQNGKVTAVTHTDGFIDEQLNARISNKEAMIMTSESDLVKESIALQSNGSSVDNVVPAELEMDLQGPLSFLTL